jgi:hypothetical protein
LTDLEEVVWLGGATKKQVCESLFFCWRRVWVVQALTILRPGVFNDQLHRACDQSCMYGSCEHLQNIGKRQILLSV